MRVGCGADAESGRDAAWNGATRRCMGHVGGVGAGLGLWCRGLALALAGGHGDGRQHSRCGAGAQRVVAGGSGHAACGERLVVSTSCPFLIPDKMRVTPPSHPPRVLRDSRVIAPARSSDSLAQAQARVAPSTRSGNTIHQISGYCAIQLVWGYVQPARLLRPRLPSSSSTIRSSYRGGASASQYDVRIEYAPTAGRRWVVIQDARDMR